MGARSNDSKGHWLTQDHLAHRSPLTRARMDCSAVLDELPLGRFHALHLLRAAYAWAAFAAGQDLTAYAFAGLHAKGLGTFESGVLSCIYLSCVIHESAGIFAAAFPAGCVAGAIICSAVGDVYGRRELMLTSTGAATVLALALVIAPGFGWLVLFRALEAVAWSIGLTTTLVWYTEFLPTTSRGALTNGFGVGWPVGRGLIIATAAVSNGSLECVLLTSATLLGGLWVLLYYCAQESPRQMLVKGDVAGAERVLRQIAQANGSTLHLTELRPLGTRQKPVARGYAELASKAQSLTRQHGSLFQFAAVLMTALACTTVLLDTWGPRTFGSLLYGTPTIPLSTVFLFNCGDLAGIALSIVVVDRIGRRGCFAIGFLVQGSLLLALVLTHSLHSGVAVSLGMLASGTRCFGWEAAHLWIIEAFPTDVRATALSAATTVMRLASVVTLAISGWFVDVVSPQGSLALVAVLQLAGGVYTAFNLPKETSGAPMLDQADTNGLDEEN